MHESQEQIKFYEDRYYQDRSNLKHNLSFAGCGFLGLYHVGVCCCIKKLAPHLYQNKRVSGTSAGAIAAVCLVCDVSIAECVQYMCELISNARRYLFGPFDPRFRITEHLREGLNRILPSDAHIICSGRLSISLTSYATHKNVVVNQFRDKDELVNALLCSAYIPIFSGFVPPTFRGQSVLDGGLSDNLLCIDKMTIRVSPFAGDADICPLDAPWDSGYLAPAPQHFEDVVGSISFLNNNIRVNRTNIRRLICVVWPMKSNELASLACQGYEDARRFLIARGFIACRLHRHSRFSLSTYNVRGEFGLTTAYSVRRFRRNTSLQNLGTNHTEFLRKRRLSGIESSHSNRPPSSPSSRCQAAHSSINLVHLNSAHGLGWNVFECAACQEELRKANNSTLPAFLLSIIRGDGKLKRGSSVPLLTSSLQIIEQGWTLVQDAIQSGTSLLYWLGRHLFCLPLLVQLDVLIEIVTKSISLCPTSTSHVPWIHHFLDSLTCARDWLALFDSNQAATSFEETAGLISTSVPQPNTRFSYLNGSVRRASHPNFYSEPRDLTSRLSSAIMTSTAKFSDCLFCLHRINLPSAAECGLELFSSQSISFSRELNVNNLDQAPPDIQLLNKSASPPPSLESGFSTDEGNSMASGPKGISQCTPQPQQSSSPQTYENEHFHIGVSSHISDVSKPYADLPRDPSLLKTSGH